MEVLLKQYRRFYEQWLVENSSKSFTAYLEFINDFISKVTSLVLTQFYLRKSEKGSGVLCRKKPSLHLRGRLKLGNDVRFWSNIHPSRISVFKGATMEIGDGSIINGSRISAKNKIIIGKNCSIAPEVTIMDSDFHEVGAFEKESTARPVIIGDHVWIATKAIILKGVTVGDHAVIAAGAIVTKDVPPYTVVAGNPARIIKEINH